MSSCSTSPFLVFINIQINISYEAGATFLVASFKITPPTTQQLRIYLENSDIKLNFNNRLISSQIKAWKPIEWQVPIKATKVLLPSHYIAGKEGK